MGVIIVGMMIENFFKIRPHLGGVYPGKRESLSVLLLHANVLSPTLMFHYATILVLQAIDMASRNITA
jgi:hypothetical protein